MLQVLLHIEDTPHRTALAFAIGVWIAFFPVWGIHTGMALAIAFLFRLNRAAIVVGAWINNPWTMAPMYMGGTILGCFFLGVSSEGLDDIDWDLHGEAFFGALVEGLRPYIWPFVIGNLTLGIVGGLAGYFALRFALDRRQQAASGAQQ
jgi:uncharacterized protein (DUF2062 family)